MDSANYISSLKLELQKFQSDNQNKQSEIISLHQLIEQLNNRINELETATSDNFQLTNEINRLNDILKEKNKIIAEFQHLAQISTMKFESCINNSQQNQCALEKKTKKLNELKLKYNPLSENYNKLDFEYKKLLNNYNEKCSFENKEISNLNEQLNKIKIENKILKEDNEKLKFKNIEYITEINSLNDKINNITKYKIEFETVKNESDNLEKEIFEKNNQLNELEKKNEELKIKLYSLEQNNKNLSNNEIELKQKLNNLQQLCQKFESSYNTSLVDLERKQIELEIMNKDLQKHRKESEGVKEKMNKQINLLKNENSILKNRQSIYQDTLSRFKNYNIPKENMINTNNVLQSVLSANNIITDINKNRIMSPKIQNINQSFMTYNPTRNNNNIDMNLTTLDNDESFRYSYYLIDNLKNTINKVDFDNEYSNLIS